MIALPLLCLAGLVAAAVLLSRARHGTLYGFRKSSRTSHTSLVFQSPELPSCGSNPDGAAHAGGCAQATDGQQEQRTVGNVLKEGHKPPTLRIIIMVSRKMRANSIARSDLDHMAGCVTTYGPHHTTLCTKLEQYAS